MLPERWCDSPGSQSLWLVKEMAFVKIKQTSLAIVQH
jgi:hypothetical protein